MAFGGNIQGSGSQPPMSEINVVPLVDVMLVLLIIFIITAPLLTHSVKVELPKAENVPNITRTENVELAIQMDGSLYWNGESVQFGELASRFTSTVAQAPQTELHIRADKMCHYGDVARVMSAAAKAGVIRIGFVTDPSEQ